ncbi:tRNA (adenosine(37)-N6)-threonylcarbamoyltransferase complex dimerization subunit type 1 TsaB [Cytobacillus sp. Hz8]|uniref:tRNA (adenosine(37)-N6)-threonylcarbamoyltransferase complex dimerization subunit type 1 TsaB n=1 Tax=Cytobacillus sp. Hz8 TaxID=3347168 RepID=UPI0035DD3D04
MNKILAIDTSSSVLGIALIDEEKVIGEHITNIKKNHSVRIMPAIELLMKECDITSDQLSKIIVAKGPGSYTGVRIGVTIAKTLAWSLKIPLVGISSIEVMAASVGRYFDGVVSPLIDARRGQVYTGLYQYKEDSLETIRDDQILLSKEWAESLKSESRKVLFVGNDLPLHRKTLEEILGRQAFFAAKTEYNPRPAELAFLGVNREGEDIHTFVPNYIRLAEAEANWLKKKQVEKNL